MIELGVAISKHQLSSQSDRYRMIYGLETKWVVFTPRRVVPFVQRQCATYNAKCQCNIAYMGTSHVPKFLLLSFISAFTLYLYSCTKNSWHKITCHTFAAIKKNLLLLIIREQSNWGSVYNNMLFRLRIRDEIIDLEQDKSKAKFRCFTLM